jgi:hypothetical protein
VFEGGEGTMSGAPGGYQATLAKNYSALLIGLEHRYKISININI